MIINVTHKIKIGIKIRLFVLKVKYYVPIYVQIIMTVPTRIKLSQPEDVS